MKAVRDEAWGILSRSAGDLDKRLRNDDIMYNFFEIEMNSRR